jgi:16S rRNA A1518/A1519 N6-dimethyltransferase RsmA/KsgA/DIM1 with predicted DNA glycosylase/AP lyase activity
MLPRLIRHYLFDDTGSVRTMLFSVAPFAALIQQHEGRLVEAVTAAFAHRRKTLANALALVGVATREQAVVALAAVGVAPDVRAEALEPGVFVALHEALR